MVFKTNCFEMHGLEQQVRTAVMNALELDVVQVSLIWTCYSEVVVNFARRTSSTKFVSSLNWPMNIENSSVARKTAKSIK